MKITCKSILTICTALSAAFFVGCNAKITMAQNELSFTTYNNIEYKGYIQNPLDDYAMELFIFEKEGETVFITPDGKEIEQKAALNSISGSSQISSGLIPVRGENNFTGYIDITGQYCIPPVLKSGEIFNNNGYAAVRMLDNNYYFIDMDFNIIKGPYYEMNHMNIQNNQVFYIGKESAESEFNFIMNEDFEILIPELRYYTDYENGFISYELDGLYGLYDLYNKKEHLKPEFTQISFFYSDSDLLFLVRDRHDSFIYDAVSQEFYDNNLEDTSLISSGYDGIVSFTRLDDETYLDNVLIDEKGNAYFKAPQFQATGFDYYLYSTGSYSDENSLYGVVSNTGEILLEPRYQQIRALSEDKLLVLEGKDYSIIDMVSGEKILIECEEAESTTVYEDTREGTYIMFQTGGLWGLMDMEGEVIIEPLYSYMYPYFRYETHWDDSYGDWRTLALIEVQNEEGLYGICNFLGETVLDIAYDNIYFHAPGVFEAYKGEAVDKVLFRNDPAMETEPVYQEMALVTVDISGAVPDHVYLADNRMIVVDGRMIGASRASFKNEYYFYASVETHGIGNISLVNTSTDDSDDYKYKVCMPQGMMAFQENSTEVQVAVFNPEKRTFEYSARTLAEPIFINKTDLNIYFSVPLSFIAETMGLNTYYDEVTGLFAMSMEALDFNETYINDHVTRMESGRHYYEMARGDGALATYPFVVSLYAEMTNTDRDILEHNYIFFSNTFASYYALINRYTDIVFAGTPNAEVYREAEVKDVEIGLYPFAKDGFVFFVHKDNPIESLTIQQIQDIYQGKITNWNEVGGPDMEIIPYQRNEDSGSQSLMRRLVMEGLEMQPPEVIQTVSSMAGVIETVAEYENSHGALGYTVYYFATEMHLNDDIKLIAVEGIQPTPESISADEYPLIFLYNMLIRENEEEAYINERVQEVMDFVLSQKGQEVIVESGLIPIPQE